MPEPAVSIPEPWPLLPGAEPVGSPIVPLRHNRRRAGCPAGARPRAPHRGELRAGAPATMATWVRLLPSPVRPDTAPHLPLVIGQGRADRDLASPRQWITPRDTEIAPVRYYLSPDYGKRRPVTRAFAPSVLAGIAVVADQRAYSFARQHVLQPAAHVPARGRARVAAGDAPPETSGSLGSMHRTFKLDLSYVNQGLDNVKPGCRTRLGAWSASADHPELPSRAGGPPRPVRPAARGPARLRPRAVQNQGAV